LEKRKSGAPLHSMRFRAVRFVS